MDIKSEDIIEGEERKYGGGEIKVQGPVGDWRTQREKKKRRKRSRSTEP